MLALELLRTTRTSKGMPRPLLATLTGIDEQRLRSLELKLAEPWWDEAVFLTRALCVSSVADLITSGDLTDCDLGAPFEKDIDIWKSGARVPLSLALRVSIALGLPQPEDLIVGDLARTIWDIVGANDRHPEHAGVCPWCVADVAMGEAHLDTCLPNNLWAPGDVHAQYGEIPPALKPKSRGKVAGIPAHGLKALRTIAGKTQKEIADQLGINANYYARLERADSPFMAEHANKLAAYYGVATERLYAKPEA